MNKTTVLLISLLLFSCNNSKEQNEFLIKENELLKKELEVEKKKKELLEQNAHKESSKPVNTEDDRDARYKLLNSDIEKMKSLLPDSNVGVYGDFSIDLGSASAGRVMGNLRDVYLSIEHLPKRPGCADICPEMIVIHFNCYDGKKCVTDPAFKEFYSNSGVISFSNIENGKMIYDLLQNIKKNLPPKHQ